MADRVLVERDPALAEQVARDVERHPHVVPLGQRDLAVVHPALVLEPAELQREQPGGRDSARHVGQARRSGAESGTRTSSKNSSEVTEARSDILRLMSRAT